MTDPGAGPRQTERRRLLQPLWNALDAHAEPAPGLLLAVSGGPDSRALLEAAARWPRRFDGEIRVASVDHRTRRESRAEAETVVARARALGFPASLLRLDVDVRGEAPLREARYRALFAEARARALGAVVVAHHQGDAAENALLSWLGRGGGPLRHRRRADLVGDLWLLRPFAALPRSALRLALGACGAVDTFADPDASSARSRVRARLLARLGSERALVEERLARASVRDDDDDALLRTLAEAHVSGGGGAWDVAHSPHMPILRRALRAALVRAGAADPRDSAAAVEIAARLMRDGRPGHVDAAGARIDVGADGNARLTARVADGRPPTHDGRAGVRLSGVSRVRTLVPKGLTEKVSE